MDFQRLVRRRLFLPKAQWDSIHYRLGFSISSKRIGGDDPFSESTCLILFRSRSNSKVLKVKGRSPPQSLVIILTLRMQVPLPRVVAPQSTIQPFSDIVARNCMNIPPPDRASSPATAEPTRRATVPPRSVAIRPWRPCRCQRLWRNLSDCSALDVPNWFFFNLKSFLSITESNGLNYLANAQFVFQQPELKALKTGTGCQIAAKFHKVEWRHSFQNHDLISQQLGSSRQENKNNFLITLETISAVYLQNESDAIYPLEDFQHFSFFHFLLKIYVYSWILANIFQECDSPGPQTFREPSPIRRESAWTTTRTLNEMMTLFITSV